MIPHCHNHPPFTGYWFRTAQVRNGKRVWRWIEFRMSQKCGSWAVSAGETPHPILFNWNCDGCRWFPNE